MRALLAAAVLATASATPAAACGGWLACAFWRGEPAAMRVPALDPSETVELVVRPSSRLTLDEADIRRAFDIAYGRQNFDDAATKEGAFRSWVATIVPQPDSAGFRNYVYKPNENHRIEATLDLTSGRMEFDIRSTNAAFARRLGQGLGLQRDSGAGLIARAYVALGGTADVKSIIASWNSSSDNYATFRRLTLEGSNDWDAADATFTGKMAKRLYGFRAAMVVDDVLFAKKVLFQPPIETLIDERGAFSRQLLGSDDDDYPSSGSPLANALGSQDEDHELPLLLPGLATGRGPHRGSVNSDDEKLQHFE